MGFPFLGVSRWIPLSFLRNSFWAAFYSLLFSRSPLLRCDSATKIFVIIPYRNIKFIFPVDGGGGLLLLDPAIRPCVFCMPMMRWRCYHISLGVSGLCTTHSRYACCTLFSTKHQAEEQPNTANAIIRTKLSNFNSEIIRHFSMPYMVYVILIRVMPYIWLSAFLLYDFA